jgi:hypothetical protein
VVAPNRPEFRADKMAGTRFYNFALAQRIAVGVASAPSAVIDAGNPAWTKRSPAAPDARSAT